MHAFKKESSNSATEQSKAKYSIAKGFGNLEHDATTTRTAKFSSHLGSPLLMVVFAEDTTDVDVEQKILCSKRDCSVARFTDTLLCYRPASSAKVLGSSRSSHTSHGLT